MAITKPTTNLTWSSSDSVSVSAGGTQTSDTFTPDATCVALSLSLKADNSTTPASDDIIHFKILYSAGDPDGTGGNEFDDPETVEPVAILDTSDVDPVQLTVMLNPNIQSFKLYADGSTEGTTNSITVSAAVTETRAA